MARRVWVTMRALFAKGSSSSLEAGELRSNLSDRLRRIHGWAEDRLGPQTPQAHIDLVLSHYLFGIVSELETGAKAKERLRFCQEMLEEIIGTQRAHDALFAVPEDIGKPAASLCRKLEQRGAKDAAQLVG